MTQRTDRVYLPPDEPRCEPDMCLRKGTCARWFAELRQGARLSTYGCPGYVSLESLHARQTKAAPAPKPWIGDAS